MIWWILPAIAGVIGLMLVFAGLGKIFNLKPASGGARLLFGVGFLGFAGIISFAGLNLQTYRALTKEREVVTISFESTGYPDEYVATLIYPGGDTVRHELTGDEWEIRARVIRFRPFANMLGYDSIYRLDRLTSGFERAEGVTEVIVRRLSEDPGLDVHRLAEARGAQLGMTTIPYGSGVYNLMEDGLAYRVFINQSGLTMEAANQATRARVGTPNSEPEAAIAASETDR